MILWFGPAMSLQVTDYIFVLIMMFSSMFLSPRGKKGKGSGKFKVLTYPNHVSQNVECYTDQHPMVALDVLTPG